MSGEAYATYAIKIDAGDGETFHFFSGFGRGNSIKTACSLAYADLFLNGLQLRAAVKRLTLKGKVLVVISVEVTHEELDLDECPF